VEFVCDGFDGGGDSRCVVVGLWDYEDVELTVG
jgi:hypothetical protein